MRKTLKKVLMTVLCLCILCSVFAVPVFAGENTTYTYTVSVDHSWIRTQDAYMSGTVYLNASGLTKPEDLYYFGGEMYIADTGNSRLYIYNIATGAVRFMGEGILSKPTGVFVDTDGTVYVADGGIPAVVIFDQNGTEIKRIERPTNFLFNELSVFQPKNVVVTSQGNIFVCGAGSYEGLMQFDRTGEFQGYFAANKTKLTARETMQELIFSEEVLEGMMKRIPRAIQNIDLADRDMIYSVTQDDNKTRGLISSNKIQNYLKKHNMTGVNILSRDGMMTEDWNFVDVAMGNDGNVYALTETGLIYEYNTSGDLIFSFGGRAVSYDRLGLFTKAAALDVDESGIIYVLDSERSYIQTFFPTEFTALTHQAVNYLDSGNYSESLETWESLLKLNGNSAIAHLGYGKTKMYQKDYKSAMEHFKICDNKEYYSQAYWETRSQWFNNNILYIFGIIVLAVIAIFVINILKKKGIIKPKPKGVSKKRNPVAREIFNIFEMLRHPLDSYYEIKMKRRGSILSATVIYIVAFAIFVWDLLFRGYLFAGMTIESAPVALVPFLFFIPLGLWLFGNNMIASINEGEGTFRSTYISSAYMFAPYMVLAPLAILLTYVLTFNEQFIVTVIWTVGLVWAGVLLFLQIMEIHNYSFGETVKNLLLILFFMIMAVITVVILYLIWTQVFAYLRDFFGEVKYRIVGY